MTYMAVGRGGEVKFNDTSEWMHHPPFGCTDVKWIESKTVSKQAMPMFSNKSSWLTDFFHCAGSYWAVEDGLFRTPEHNGIQTFLFPNLHEMQNNSVSQKMTAIIHRCLPQGIPAELVKEYSAKSIRKGAVSNLLVHPELNGLGDNVAEQAILPRQTLNGTLTRPMSHEPYEGARHLLDGLTSKGESSHPVFSAFQMVLETNQLIGSWTSSFYF